MNTKKIKVYTLTPLHIGSGTEFDPTTFWIDSNTNELIEFKEEDFINTLSEQEKDNIGNMDLFEIMRLIKSKKIEGIHKKVSFDIANNYDRVLKNNNINEFNKFGIKKTISNPNTEKAYIPGSSIKGALRTGYIYSKRNNIKIKTNWNRKEKNEKIDEDALLGKMEQDVFGSLKVSDCVSNLNVDTSIGYVDRVSKKVDSKTGKYKHLKGVTMLESINSGVVFEGSLSLFSEKETKIKFKDIEEVLQSVDGFSYSLLQDKSIGITYPTQEQISKIKQGFKNKTYLCRLGGFIGAESHTIDGFRDIKIINRQKRNDFRKNTTRLLYATQSKEKTDNNNIGFGWCIIELIEDENVSENLELKNFILEQQKILNTPQMNLNSSPVIKNNKFIPKNKSVSTYKPTFDRTQPQVGKIIKFSKKGKPIVSVHNEEFTMVDGNATDFQIGQEVTVILICATCKLKK